MPLFDGIRKLLQNAAGADLQVCPAEVLSAVNAAIGDGFAAVRMFFDGSDAGLHHF